MKKLIELLTKQYNDFRGENIVEPTKDEMLLEKVTLTALKLRAVDILLYDFYHVDWIWPKHPDFFEISYKDFQQQLSAAEHPEKIIPWKILENEYALLKGKLKGFAEDAAGLRGKHKSDVSHEEILNDKLFRSLTQLYTWATKGQYTDYVPEIYGVIKKTIEGNAGIPIKSAVEKLPYLTTKGKYQLIEYCEDNLFSKEWSLREYLSERNEFAG